MPPARRARARQKYTKGDFTGNIYFRGKPRYARRKIHPDKPPGLSTVTWLIPFYPWMIQGLIHAV